VPDRTTILAGGPGGWVAGIKTAQPGIEAPHILEKTAGTTPLETFDENSKSEKCLD
jgi:hypothetical protein